MDIFTQQKRSEVMSRIRGKDTRPEMTVRKYLHSKGLRFRLHGKGLPGKPDLVFARRRAVVFVHGCFWHGHKGCPRAALPTTRQDFWSAKIGATGERDQRTRRKLEENGWTVLVVWQCEISAEKLEGLATTLRSPLRCDPS
ncbi:DNA mismatch endonuclease Vsr [Mesorhizobium sp. NZP2234]|nr:very short patch repair endonuclease [Mesorhizobium sp. NZP2234]QKC92907.1 DNA mismatch endonuclease Vsr [Mesorhizobium sp. NZP2234]